MNIEKAAEAYKNVCGESAFFSGLCAAAPHLQAQPQPVDGELVDAMYEIISEMVDVRKAAQDCGRVAADRLHKERDEQWEKVLREVCHTVMITTNHCMNEGHAEQLINKVRACLTAKKTPEEEIVSDYLQRNLPSATKNCKQMAAEIIAKLRESDGKQ